MSIHTHTHTLLHSHNQLTVGKTLLKGDMDLLEHGFGGRLVGGNEHLLEAAMDNIGHRRFDGMLDRVVEGARGVESL